MDQLTSFADSRLLQGCVYCGAPNAGTRDHVPSRVLLDPPFPTNLPVVPSCLTCNNGFSRDEEYFACLIECVVHGTTDPEAVMRQSVAGSLRRSLKLRTLLESQRTAVDGQVVFEPTVGRVEAVVRKLAIGHAAYELVHSNPGLPTALWYGPLTLMSPEQRQHFDAPQIVDLLGEVGSRGMQRMVVTQVAAVDQEGNRLSFDFIINDWVDVQDGRYRYLAADLPNGVLIRFVVAEYFAAEVWWASDDNA